MICMALYFELLHNNTRHKTFIFAAFYTIEQRNY
jgi:hypothetical protein